MIMWNHGALLRETSGIDGPIMGVGPFLKAVGTARCEGNHHLNLLPDGIFELTYVSRKLIRRSVAERLPEL